MLTYAEIQAKAAALGPLLPVPDPTLANVKVGWSVYERCQGDYWPRGGIVVHIVPNAEPDPESGELVDRYVTVKVGKLGELTWCSLRADRVGRPEEPNNQTIEGVLSVAARKLQKVKLNDLEKALELWSLGARLMAVVARPGTEAP